MSRGVSTKETVRERCVITFSSGNRRAGELMVTTSPRGTCPSACPLPQRCGRRVCGAGFVTQSTGTSAHYLSTVSDREPVGDTRAAQGLRLAEQLLIVSALARPWLDLAAPTRRRDLEPRGERSRDFDRPAETAEAYGGEQGAPGRTPSRTIPHVARPDPESVSRGGGWWIYECDLLPRTLSGSRGQTR